MRRSEQPDKWLKAANQREKANLDESVHAFLLCLYVSFLHKLQQSHKQTLVVGVVAKEGLGQLHKLRLIQRVLVEGRRL